MIGKFKRIAASNKSLFTMRHHSVPYCKTSNDFSVRKIHIVSALQWWKEYVRVKIWQFWCSLHSKTNHGHNE